ncbi:MAG: hypothetical protein GAK28_04805 [Luteibacter sp.]|uniref:hypothetical protein n=1 Tax=Luteibacter sp. TaxID=1886636 RepID=UPI001380A85C|nr:hypothetical protein [Luteibacter sp.]KAF1003300.1 MAG: hypothetical protein GAK28_04805 [Luteibacter sp.]
MILTFADGKQIRGDLIKSAILRSDLSPVPLTLEAEFRGGDDGMEKKLAEGQIILANGGDALRIIQSEAVPTPTVQGDRMISGLRVTALLDACADAAYVRQRAIIKENASLAGIYRAAGATVKSVTSDFAVPRFYCLAGDTPTFSIARILQEAGGAVRWKSGRLQFLRLADIFAQAPVMTLPDNTSENVTSGFLERHAVPWFFSIDPSGALIYGNRDKARAVGFAPFQDEQRLRNMSRCLVLRKVTRAGFSGQVAAGDLVAYTGGAKLGVITAAHVFESGTDDGGSQNSYTRLWVGSLEG